MTNSPFNDYSAYIRDTFGERVQKISINRGYTCPNRDGTKARGGCSYCNVKSIEPSYLKSNETIADQLKKGIHFFEQRKPGNKYFAYFQSYTNTYEDLALLEAAYRSALTYPGVVGLIVGTRPDCIDENIAKLLEGLASQTYVSVEIGVESTENTTLERVNRCHTFEDVIEAFDLLKNKNIHLAAHLILGFPWESIETQVNHAMRLSALPVQSLKLHHLQILSNTMLAREHRRTPFSLLTMEQYKALVIEFIKHTRSDIIFQRFLAEAPQSMLIAPHYNIRNYQFSDILKKEMLQQNIVQGSAANLSGP